MTPRYRRARELSGLSLKQAAKRLCTDPLTLAFMEIGRKTVSDSRQRVMARLYGCSLAWLQGAEPEIPESTCKMLREADISPKERDDLMELLGSMGHKG